MKRYNYIVQTGKEPSTDTLWIHKNNLKFFNNGTWSIIEGSVTKDWVYDTFQKAGVAEAGKLIYDESNTLTWFTDNGLDLLHDNIPVVLWNIGGSKAVSPTGKGRVFGNMYNGQISTIVDGKLNIYNVDYNSPDHAVAHLKTVELSSLPSFVDLSIGTTSAIKSLNKEKLQKVAGTQFFAHIDYGIGVGAWLPTTGGYATINTAQGDRVHYKLGADGSVVKDDTFFDHSDLFYEIGDISNPINLSSFNTEATQTFIIDSNTAIAQLQKAAHLTLCCIGSAEGVGSPIWVTCPITSINCSDGNIVDSKVFNSPDVKIGQTSWNYLKVTIAFIEGQASVTITAT